MSNGIETHVPLVAERRAERKGEKDKLVALMNAAGKAAGIDVPIGDCFIIPQDLKSGNGAYHTPEGGYTLDAQLAIIEASISWRCGVARRISASNIEAASWVAKKQQWIAAAQKAAREAARGE